MASGSILGKCKICDGLIWEDEDWEIKNDKFYHAECLEKFGDIEEKDLQKVQMLIKHLCGLE